MAKFKSTKDTAGIKKQIASVKTRGKAWQDDVQTCAVNIAEHVKEHHEVSLVNMLIDAMPNGARVNALRAWFEACAKVVYDEETKLFIPSRDAAPELQEGYPSWYDFKPEPEFKPFDLNAQIALLIKKASKADAADERNKIDEDTLNTLKTLVEVK